jgi:hypothetical protein
MVCIGAGFGKVRIPMAPPGKMTPSMNIEELRLLL